MTRDGSATAVQDRTQRDGDHQRWADDGGHSPEPRPDEAHAAMPVRSVYYRAAGWRPPALLCVLPGGTLSAP